MKITVIGTGYVGLTTALALAYLNHEVTCLDVDEGKIAQLREGNIPIYEPFTEELMGLVGDRIHFTTQCHLAIPTAEVVFIAVGTPSLPDGSADLQFVRAAAEGVGNYMWQPSLVVVNKSTVPVGTGRWVEGLIRQTLASKNGKVPHRVAVASNPEFLREGSALHDALFADRVVVGADDPWAIEVLRSLYLPLLEQDFVAPPFLPRPEGLRRVPLVATDLVSAELIKYAANAFLATKISFANEIAQLTERVRGNITDVMQGMGLDHRIGPRFLQAGLGWGGSCFGKDTSALVATAREHGLCMPITEAARRMNYLQRDVVVAKLLAELERPGDRTVGILGLSFKPNTDDLRDSPALDIAQRLLSLGIRVKAHDPAALERVRREYGKLALTLCEAPEALALGSDALVLATEWPQYLHLPWAKLASEMRKPVIVDGRNFLDKRQLESFGFRYLGIGR